MRNGCSHLAVLCIYAAYILGIYWESSPTSRYDTDVKSDNTIDITILKFVIMQLNCA